MKRWIVGSADEKKAVEFKSKCDLSMLVLELLTARGMTDFQQAVEFFSSESLSDPFVLADMSVAVEIINEYIDSYKLICVYGDYDCDGITATAVLYSYLLSMGANVTYYINERDEGYGMTLEAVERLHDKGVELIITVDNGISCVGEAERIYELGMKLVITDHHQPPEELPKAEAVINPHRRDCPSLYKNLAGVGVALKLCAALDGGEYDAVVEQYADLCAIGTVGDLVELNGENRALVKKGLLYLKNTESLGLNELMDHAAVDRDKLSSSTLAFQICPRINAAGRFGSPLMALEAVLTENPQQADELADKLCSLNNERRETEAKIFSGIKQYINKNPQVLDKRVIVLAGNGWHHGVIGIVSARVLEAYGKPNIIISIDENGIGRGSARSLKGFSIHSALTYASEYLEKFGGHECAGGLTIKKENISAFVKKVLEYADEMKIMPMPLTECDMVMPPNELTVESIKSLNVLEPFGTANPKPMFCMPNCRVNAIYPLSGGKHTKINVTYGAKNVNVLVFSKSPESMFFNIGDFIDIAANIDINEYNGKESVSVKAADMRPANMQTEKYFAAKDCWEKLNEGKQLPISFVKRIVPSRNELVYVYKLLSGQRQADIDFLYMKINNPAINYCKLRIIIRVFCEAGLAELNAAEQSVSILDVRSKVDLNSTYTMKQLYAMLG
ncbi:MAG: single-stranded-DNA-specific exonuclease RecJ [Ruminococcus sp.]|nr:single-stranded-DNA-specific exonuclease RecJ [Ruminococcus sp.]